MFVLKHYRSSWSGFRSTNRYEYGALVALISLYSKISNSLYICRANVANCPASHGFLNSTR